MKNSFTTLAFCWFIIAIVNHSTADENVIQAVVFGQEITTKDLTSAEIEIAPGIKAPRPYYAETQEQKLYRALSSIIYRKLNLELDKQCQVSVTELQVQNLVDLMEKQEAESDFKDKIDEIRENFLNKLSEEERQRQLEAAEKGKYHLARHQWKTYYRFKCLYETYGGVVIWQQANPQEPVGAMKTYLKKLETEGKLIINDPVFHEQFWRYYNAEPSFVIAPEKVDFSQPWWVRLK